MKIAVLMGGASAERGVSLASGRAIAQALRAKGHRVVPIDAAGGRVLCDAEIDAELARALGPEPPDLNGLPEPAEGDLLRAFRETPDARDVEVIFVALHGGAGEDGRVQAILDAAGVPYTGSGPLGSALAMDKLAAKTLFIEAGVPTPPWLTGPVEPAEVERELGGYPVVVKPAREGSTVGVSVVRSRDELEKALETASRYSGPPLVERYVPGRELAAGVLGEAALPLVEIRPQHEIYDYECKYTKGMSSYEVPASLPERLTRRVQELAVRAHAALRLSDYSRVDFRLDPQGRAWCLEVNALPGMTATSLLPKAAAAAGVGFEELCDRIVSLALERAAGSNGTPIGAGG